MKEKIIKSLLISEDGLLKDEKNIWLKALLWMMRDLRAMVKVIIGKNYLPELKILGHQNFKI